MKKFAINCEFGNARVSVDFFISDPTPNLLPIFFQELWLRSERGGIVPQSIQDSFVKLATLARDNHVSFEELCVYAFKEAYKMQDDATEDGDSTPSG